MKPGFTIGRLAGIPLSVHPLWFAMVALITWSLGESYFPERIPGVSPTAAYALGLVSALLLFVSIVLHELGHSVVARRRGVEIEGIELWLLGGVARMKGDPKRATDELMFALAGPAVSVVIATVFGLAAVILPKGSPPALVALVEYQAIVNAAIIGLNMLPAFPLDGGRVARATIWKISGDKTRATIIAASLGRAFGYGLIALGLLALFGGAAGGIWFGMIGMFVLFAAGAEERRERLRDVFSNSDVGDLMSRGVVSIPDGITVAEAIHGYFIPYRYTAFPVTNQLGQATGLISHEMVKAVPANRRATLQVRTVAHTDQDVLIHANDTITTLLDRPRFQAIGRVVVVNASGEPCAILSITDVDRAMRSSALLAGDSERK